jgi:hypothetical protein
VGGLPPLLRVTIIMMLVLWCMKPVRLEFGMDEMARLTWAAIYLL